MTEPTSSKERRETVAAGRLGWASFASAPAADPDFLLERPELVDAGRFGRGLTAGGQRRQRVVSVSLRRT